MFTRRAVLIVLVLASITLIVGWLVRQTIDSVVIVPDSLLSQRTERVFVLGRQHRLEQSAGLRRRTLRGMGTGLLLGAAGGGILGAWTWACPPYSLICFSRGISAAAGAVLLALPGLVVGGIVGGQKTHEAWRPMGDRQEASSGRLRIGGLHSTPDSCRGLARHGPLQLHRYQSPIVRVYVRSTTSSL